MKRLDCSPRALSLVLWLTLILVMAPSRTTATAAARTAIRIATPAPLLSPSASQVSATVDTTTITTTAACPLGPSAPITPTLTYLGPATATYGTPVALAALLTDGGGNPLPGRTLSFSFDGQSVTATTDQAGVATAGVTPLDAPDSITATVAFAGDKGATAVQTTAAVTIGRAPTALTYTGALPGMTAPRQVVGTVLHDTVDGSPVAFATVHFTLGPATAMATTDATGAATATLTLSTDQASDGAPLQVSYAGDSDYQAASLSVPGSLYLPTAFGAVVARHVPAINGNGIISGTVRQLSGENVIFNGNAAITGDLLVPGTPRVQVNGHPSFAGVVPGTGSVQPTDYMVTLNGQVQLGHIVTRTDPVTMSAVALPPAPAGARDVVINSSGQSIGDPATLRNLTLNGNVGLVTLPPGVYGQVTVDGGSVIVLGVAGATTPARYNVQGLNLNGATTLRLLGPVILTVANGVSLNGQTGAAANPLWLTLDIASGGFTLNGGSAFYGVVRAPSGQVIINGNSVLHGTIFANNLIVNGGGVVQGVATPAGYGQTPLLVTTREQPATALPGQGLDVMLRVTNTTGISATAVTAQEGFVGTTPATGTADLGAIGGGTSATTTFHQTVPAIAGRSVGETSGAYLTRLAAAEGQTLPASGLVTYADVSGQGYAPLAVSSSSMLALPRLSLGLTSPACTIPGTRIPYTVRVTNLGRAPATNAAATVTFADGSVGRLPIATLAPGATITGTLTWTVPAVPARGAAEATADYLARLAAADGATYTAQGGVTWQDAVGNSYGPVDASATVTGRLPVVAISAQTPTTLVPGQVVTTTLTLTNTGSLDAASATARVTNPDGSVSTAQAPVPAGRTVTLYTTWLVPALPHATTQSTGAYLSSLAAIDGGSSRFATSLSWADQAGASYGPIAGTGGGAGEPLPIVALAVSGPPAARGDDAISYIVSLTNTGSADAGTESLTLIMPDGSLRVSAIGPLAAGASAQVTVPYTVSHTRTSGDTTVRARVTWQDDAQNAFGPVTATATTSMTALPTDTPTNTRIATATPTATDTPTSTSTPTTPPSDTPTNTATSQPSDTPTNTPQPSYQTNGLSVSVGYIDTLRANPNVPVPWVGDPGVIYLGRGGYEMDSGAIRIDNTTGATINVRNVTVDLHSDGNDNPYPGQSFNLWPSFSIPPGDKVILAATSGDNFDTSDFPIPSGSCSGTDPTNNPPRILLTRDDGTQVVLTDTAHVLDTGGADTANCPVGNESLNWRPLGTVGVAQAAATLVLQVPATPPIIGLPYAQLAHLTDASGAPLSGVTVNFAVNSGPNAGQTGRATTDSGGTATFTYTGTVIGTDAVAASVTNASGASFSADPINVTWIVPPPTYTPTDTPTNTAIPSDTPPAAPSATSTPPGLPDGSGPVQIPGWIAGPGVQSSVSGQVPIVLTQGETLRQGIVDYWPADAPNDVTTLAANATGSGTIATLDTTTLEDGSYVIRLRGLDTNGNGVTSETSVMATGAYKPGRVRFTVTDFTVPVAGLPIQIQRTYDSLVRGRVGDFGHGWSLGIASAHLQVDPGMNVTLDLPNGKRSTFYFRSQGHILYETPAYSPGPGVYGSLSANGCGLIEAFAGSAGYGCLFGDGPNGAYQPDTYTYTDPQGRVYTYGADGALRSVRDLSGSTLTISANGIVSSAGDQVVPFTRDDQGRITSITNPDGNVYHYGYDANGDLSTVVLPGATQPISYTYDADHSFRDATDPRGYTGAAATYYPDGRLESVTDPLSNTTRYAYDMAGRTTTITNPDDGTVATTYDPAGNILSRTDPLSHTTTYAYYPGTDRVETTTDPLNHTTTYNYDGAGCRTAITDPLNHIRRMQCNQYGSPVSMTDPMGNVTTVGYTDTTQPYLPSAYTDGLGLVSGYSYDSHGNPLTYTDGNGKVTSYHYDAYGNKTSETDPLRRTTAYSYDAFGRLLSSTDPLTRTTSDAYDASGRAVETINALGQVTRDVYDGDGDRAAEVNPDGGATLSDYDAADRLQKITYPDHTTRSFTYDWRGHKLTETDQAGHITRYHYDLAGQLDSVTRAAGTPDESTVRYHRDAAGRLDSTTDAMGRVTRYDYYDDGRVWHVYAPLGHTTTYTYDADGRKQSVTDGDNHTTRYDYDARGRLTTTTYDNNTTSQTVYDGVGDALQQVDQAHKATTYAYDDAGELLSVTDPMSETVGYHYDLSGELDRVTDANGHMTQSHYDALGRLDKKTWPDNSYESYGYDDNGDQTSHRLADGNVNTSGYDAMHRLTSIAYFDGQRVGYTYTPTGQRATMTDGRGTTRYAYDAQDRLTSIAGPDNQGLAYTYYPDGQRHNVTTPAGTTSYAYDDAGALYTVTDPLSGTATYSHDGAGNLSGLTLPDGIAVSYGYDDLNRLQSILQQRGDQTLGSYTYTLDPSGHRTKVVEADGSSIAWGYDDAYRLTGETRYDSGGNATARTGYTYDPTGNRTAMTAGGQTTSYSYNALDQLTSAGTEQYSYDGRGNLTGVTDGSGATTYAYDAADRLTSATLPDGTSAGYGYDGDGRRVSQIAGGRTTNYLWDPTTAYGDIVLETDGSGTPQASYVLGADRIVSQTRGGATSYYLYDGQGSTRALADSSGAVTDTYSYDAFGDPRGHQGTSANPYLYTGQRYDATTGLYDLRARAYNPIDGRLLSRDPAAIDVTNPIELDRYPYVANDPVNAIDPSGWQSFVEGDLIQNADGGEQAPAAAETAEATAEDVALIDANIDKVYARQLFQDAIDATGGPGYIPNVVLNARYLDAAGEEQEIVTMKDFYPPRNAVTQRLTDISDWLDKYAEGRGAIFRGGTYDPAGNPATAAHAEDNLVEVVKDLLREGKIKPNSIVSGGISRARGFCTRCADLGTPVGGNALKIAVDTVTIILAY